MQDYALVSDKSDERLILYNYKQITFITIIYISSPIQLLVALTSAERFLFFLNNQTWGKSSHFPFSYFEEEQSMQIRQDENSECLWLHVSAAELEGHRAATAAGISVLLLE